MSDKKWFDNSIQFPRLLAEIQAVVEFTPQQRAELCETMDLNWDDICELFERAGSEFEGIKYEMQPLFRDRS